MKRRILILCHEFPPLGGGGGVAAYKLAKGFFERGYSIDIMTSGFGNLPHFEVVEGMHVYRVAAFGRDAIETASVFSMMAYIAMASIKGVSLCSKNKYDFIHTHFALPSGIVGHILSMVYKKKNILSIHGGDIYDPSKRISPHRFYLFRILIRYLINSSHKTVAQSLDTKNNAVQYYALNKTIDIIPLPYEQIDFVPADRTRLGMDMDKRYVIGVGRLVKRKAFDVYINVIARLDPSVIGLIIGEGPERSHLESLASKLGVSDRVMFLGNINDNKKMQYLSNSNVFLLSSSHEGFGIVLQEAMQAHLPIVATDKGGQNDFIQDGVNGYLVKTGDVEAIVEKVRLLLTDGTLSEKISGAGNATLAMFKSEMIVGKYIDLSN